MVPLMIVSAMLPSPFFAEFRTKEKECPTDSAPAPIGQTPIAEPFGGSVETFAPCKRNYMSFSPLPLPYHAKAKIASEKRRARYVISAQVRT